jgi:23S rRNA C2498 (ribose-2'-O)-methylase RlmM
VNKVDLEQRLRAALVVLERMMIKLSDLFLERLDSGFFNLRMLSDDARRFTSVLREVVQLKKELAEAERGADDRTVLLIRDVLVVFLRELRDDLVKQFGVKQSDAVSFVNKKKKELEERINRVIKGGE